MAVDARFPEMSRGQERGAVAVDARFPEMSQGQERGAVALDAQHACSAAFAVFVALTPHNAML